MLTILNEPTGSLGVIRHEWDYTKTIQENIQLHMDAGFGCKVFFHGVEVDPMTCDQMNRLPSTFDAVAVVRRPEGLDPITWLYIAVVVLAVAVYTMMPKAPGVSGTGNESPNNNLTGQTNVARTYQAIPDVYGYRRVWPDLIQPSTIEYVDHLKYVTEWMCISRGIGEVSLVNYAETPIGDIEGASYEVFEPTPSIGYPEFSTTTLMDVIETFASDEVNGQEIPPPVEFATITKTGSIQAVITETTFTATFVDSAEFDNLKSLAGTGFALVTFVPTGGSDYFNQNCGVISFTTMSGNVTFTFSSTAWAFPELSTQTITIVPDGATPLVQGPYTLPLDGERIRWNTVFLRGLKGTVVIRAEWWKITGAGVEIPGTRQTQDDSYSADTYDQRFWTKEVTPSGGSGRYRVQFARLSDQIGDGSSDVAKLEELYAVRHYAEKVLPGVTVIRVTTKATLEATGFSDRKFNLRWLRKIRTLYTDDLSTSRNFARTMCHIWTLAGNDVSELDTGQMAAINIEHGETSNLLSFDMSLDDNDMSLGERMQLVADSARCIVWRDGTKWTVTRDQAKAYPEMQLDYRNLSIDGESAISYAAHLPASNDGVEIEYVDEATQSKKTYVRLDISTGAIVSGLSGNPKKFKQPGCTTLELATNRAQLEARKLLYQRVSVTDTAMNDGGALGRGSLVRWVDPNDFAGDDGLQAGEVLSIDGLLIKTSEPLDFKGATHGRILFTGVNGEYLGAPVFCYPSSEYVVRLESINGGVYVAGGNRQLGSRYTFAVGLTNAEMESSGLYLVTEIKPASKGKLSLSLAEYDERIYGFDT